jgi:hypothetical protein
VQGVVQGSVSSMPYFCIAIHAALGGIPTDQNLATLGFADDLSLLGKAADMAAALPGLKADLGAVGLRLQEQVDLRVPGASRRARPREARGYERVKSAAMSHAVSSGWHCGMP